VGITISQLHAEDLTSWPETRLRVWAKDVPLILIHALPGEGLDEQARRLFPRPRGFYSEEDLAAVAHYTVSAQASASHAAWSALLAWSGALYREYHSRIGKHHPGHMRTAWLAIACQPLHNRRTEMSETITQADMIAATYGHDGQSFFLEGRHIAELARERADHRWDRSGDAVYVMPDGSLLGVSDGGWDVLSRVDGFTADSRAALEEAVERIEVSETWEDSNGIAWAVLDVEDYLWTDRGLPYSWRRA